MKVPTRVNACLCAFDVKEKAIATARPEILNIIQTLEANNNEFSQLENIECYMDANNTINFNPANVSTSKNTSMQVFNYFLIKQQGNS